MSERPSSSSRKWLIGSVVLLSAILGTAWAFRETLFPPTPSEGGSSDRKPTHDGLACLGKVDAENGVTSLSPVQAGQVTKVLVRESQVVKAGAELLRLDDRAVKLKVVEAQAALDAALAQQRDAADQPKLHALKLTQQKAALSAARLRLEAARKLLEHKKRLLKFQMISEEELAAAETQIEELKELERTETVRQQELEMTNPRLAEERAKAEVTAARARLDQARQAEAEHTLKAPTDGTILQIQVAPGDTIGPTRTAIQFRGAGPLIVRAEIDQEFAQRVKEGMKATIRDHANPKQVWKGEVIRVAPWFSQRRLGAMEGAAMQEELILECVISMKDPVPMPRLNQRVRVWIGEPGG